MYGHINKLSVRLQFFYNCVSSSYGCLQNTKTQTKDFLCLSIILFGLISATAEPIFIGISLVDRGSCRATYKLLFILLNVSLYVCTSDSETVRIG